MPFPRRDFIGASVLALGANLVDLFTRPLCGWTGATAASAGLKAGATSDGVTFVDVARSAGLTIPNVWGGVNEKRYIIETKGSGLAFFDYDHDGWLDVYLTNGVRLGETYAPGKAPTSHLYKNNRDGTFKDVTERSGLARTGWQTGVGLGSTIN